MRSYHGKTANFHFYGSFTGEVYVNCKDRDGNDTEFAIAAEDLLDFIAQEYILPNRIAKLEQASTVELLLGDNHEG